MPVNGSAVLVEDVTPDTMTVSTAVQVAAVVPTKLQRSCAITVAVTPCVTSFPDAETIYEDGPSVITTNYWMVSQLFSVADNC